MKGAPAFFGVRHLSPGGAWHLRKFLDEKKPRLVLVEGPSDLNEQMCQITRPETVPPIAILAYTDQAPIRTILYPFAAYSPEYQAILWAFENNAVCRFMDLPSDVFLAFSAARPTEGDEGRETVYDALDEKAGEGGHETFWERTLEHGTAFDAYRLGAGEFGARLRELTAGKDNDWAETVVREAWMRRCIFNAVEEGFEPEEIVVVTGSFHVEGLKTGAPMTDEEVVALPRVSTSQTLMPYSYYRLSSRSGYGAGNKAPAYYELLWEALCQNTPTYAAHKYLSRIAGWQRTHGNQVSVAEVIEAVRLATSLGEMRGSRIPTLADLRDAAVTCFGHGEFISISLAVADTEIGTKIGALPEGVSRTSIQDDFYRQMREMKLEKYRALTAQDLTLDLRENRMVKSKKAAFLDLYRSFFLHQLRVIGVHFAQPQAVSQDNATWSERWILQWTPEVEIELVESALKGDTILLAANYVMKEQVDAATGMGQIAAVIEDAFTCGMGHAVEFATSALQKMAVDAASIKELGTTAHRLSVVIQYGNIRQVPPAPLEPILAQVFFRACLLLPGACVCDDNGAKEVVKAMNLLNQVSLVHDFLETEPWLNALRQTAFRDDLNTIASGYAAAILLERGDMDTPRLQLEVQRRLSRSVPADLGAGWFEGLSMKNRYALIARLSLWESLNDYLDSLDEEEFKRALVFLRRAFADFTAKEKDSIAENLGEIWQINPQAVSEALNTPIAAPPEEVAAALDGFDFDDF